MSVLVHEIEIHVRRLSFFNEVLLINDQIDRATGLCLWQLRELGDTRKRISS